MLQIFHQRPASKNETTPSRGGLKIGALIEKFEDQVCAPKDFYNLAISFEMTIDESMATCKHKLNNSIVPSKNGVCLLNMVKHGPNGHLNRTKWLEND